MSEDGRDGGEGEDGGPGYSNNGERGEEIGEGRECDGLQCSNDGDASRQRRR